jgi:hypothetical protein
LYKGKNLKEKISSSGVIAWCGFIKDIVSFTWINKIVQLACQTILKTKFAISLHLSLYCKHFNDIIGYYIIRA